MRRRALLAVLPLAGCGFRPVYMPTASGRAGVAERELSAINVPPITDRPGQVLRQALQTRFDRADSGLARKYDIAVDYSIAGEGIGIRRDNSVTRFRLIARANWTLLSQDPARTALTHGRARAFDNVNVLDQQYFAVDLGTEAAQRRLAETVADQITLELASYFRHRDLPAG